MRKSLWIILAVMVVAVSAPNAHADTVYAITFNGFGAPTVVGSNLLDYNSTLMEFTSPNPLVIKYEGVDINLVNLFLTPIGPNDQFFWEMGLPANGYFSIIDESRASYLFSSGFYSGLLGGKGEVTLTAQTPEPSSVVLMLPGLALVLLRRKRNSPGHQLAT